MDGLMDTVRSGHRTQAERQVLSSRSPTGRRSPTRKHPLRTTALVWDTRRLWSVSARHFVGSSPSDPNSDGCDADTA